jgi:hypothetical protein
MCWATFWAIYLQIHLVTLVVIHGAALNLLNSLLQIKAILFGQCNFLTGQEQNCKDFVSKHLPIIISLLVDEFFDPGEVCFTLNVC